MQSKETWCVLVDGELHAVLGSTCPPLAMEGASSTVQRLCDATLMEGNVSFREPTCPTCSRTRALMIEFATVYEEEEVDDGVEADRSDAYRTHEVSEEQSNAAQ